MVSVAELAEGQVAKVISMGNSCGLKRKLENLGIREGVKIHKIRGVFARGPVIVKIGRSQIALGRGMASKIMVEVL
jgi:ferrous iron transport protein A